MPKKIDIEENEKIIKHNISLSLMGDVDMDDAEQVEKRTMEYFYTCAENGMQASYEGLALAFGMNSNAFRDKVIMDSPIDVQRIIARAWQVCNCILVDMGTTGGVHPAITCFLAKNNFGYTDETKITHEVKTPLGDAQEQKKLQARYENLPIVAEKSDPKTIYDRKKNEW